MHRITLPCFSTSANLSATVVGVGLASPTQRDEQQLVEGRRVRDPGFASTFLFVPGDRPGRFMRAAESGADAILIDLEDGVSPASRPAARNHARSWLQSGRSAIVRLNAYGTEDHDLDVLALKGAATQVMLSKAESAADAEATAEQIGGSVVVMALIETPSRIDGRSEHRLE